MREHESRVSEASEASAVNEVRDFRRWVAARSHGAAVFMLIVQSRLEDFEGALEAGQLDVAIGLCREVVLKCLSIRGIEATGRLPRRDHELADDPLLGIPDDELAAAFSLLRFGALEATPDALAAWRDGVIAFARETETRIGLGELPVLRSPRGLYPSLALTRLWAPVVASARLPELLPASWLDRGNDAPDGG